MRMVLEQKFFERSAAVVGRSLLGKFLVRAVNGRELAFPITEVEVYDGFEDRASHAFRGRTARNQVMFGDAGYLYVYFVYGNHWMLNVVIGKKDYPAAALIRGVGEWNGPGKLTKALFVDKDLNGKLATPVSGLWFEDRGLKFRHGREFWKIKTMPRVGVDYAGKKWSKKPYRFLLVSSVEIKKVKRKK